MPVSSHSPLEARREAELDVRALHRSLKRLHPVDFEDPEAEEIQSSAEAKRRDGISVSTQEERPLIYGRTLEGFQPDLVTR
jgi:hypothetical protein